MIAARRVYFYVVSFVSLWMIVIGGSTLAGRPIQQGTSVGAVSIADEMTFHGAIALVGLIGATSHWALAQHLASRDSSERRSAIRAFFLYASLLSFLAGLGFTLIPLVQTLIQAPLAGELASLGIDLREQAVGIFFILFAGLAWLFLWHTTRRDAAAGENDLTAIWRRTYFYLVIALTATTGAGGIAVLLQALWRYWVAPVLDARAIGRMSVSEAAGEVSGALAVALIAGSGWWLHYQWTNRLAAGTGVDARRERNATARLAGLLAIVLAAVTGTVVGLWLLAGQLLSWLLEIPRSEFIGTRLLLAEEIALPIGLAIGYGGLWASHRYLAAREMRWRGEMPTVGVTWMLYHLVVTGVFLAAFAIGTGNLVRLIWQWVGDSAHLPTDTAYWIDQISLTLPLFAIGLIGWVWHWRQVQRDLGAAPAPSAGQLIGVRRVYFYLVFLATTLAMLGFGTLVLYRLLGWTFQVDTADPFVDLVAGPLGALVSGSLVSWYHYRQLRSDSTDRRAIAQPATPPVSEPGPVTTIIVLRGIQPDQADAAVRRLRANLPASIGVEHGALTPEDEASLHRLLHR